MRLSRFHYSTPPTGSASMQLRSRRQRAVPAAVQQPLSGTLILAPAGLDCTPRAAPRTVQHPPLLGHPAPLESLPIPPSDNSSAATPPAHAPAEALGRCPWLIQHRRRQAEQMSSAAGAAAAAPPAALIEPAQRAARGQHAACAGARNTCSALPLPPPALGGCRHPSGGALPAPCLSP